MYFRAMRIPTLALLALAALGAIPARASPIVQNYAFDLNFTDVIFTPCSSSFPGCTHSDPVLANTTYTGYFGVDSSYLVTDGFVDAPFAYFTLTLGGYTWDVNLPDPLSDLTGTVYYNPSTGVGGRAPNLETFVVQNGGVQTICCGVYGSGDVPFVDLISGYAGAATPGGNRDSFQASGTFTVYRVPEPTTWALLLAALGGLAFARLRRPRGYCSGTGRGILAAIRGRVASRLRRLRLV